MRAVSAVTAPASHATAGWYRCLCSLRARLGTASTLRHPGLPVTHFSAATTMSAPTHSHCSASLGALRSSRAAASWHVQRRAALTNASPHDTPNQTQPSLCLCPSARVTRLPSAATCPPAALPPSVVRAPARQRWRDSAGCCDGRVRCGVTRCVHRALSCCRPPDRLRARVSVVRVSVAVAGAARCRSIASPAW